MIDYKSYAKRAIEILKGLPEAGYMTNVGTVNSTHEILQEWEDEHMIGEYPLPDWAEAYNHNYEPVLRAQLCTKDGRRMGNARIVEIIENHPMFLKETCIYKIRTDVGTEFNLMKSELDHAFYIGMFIMKPDQ